MSLSAMDRSSKQKINKKTADLNNTIDQIDLTDIYIMFHPTAVEYTFFLSAHGPFFRIDHKIGHKPNLSKFKKIESYQISFPTIMFRNQ